MDRHPKFAVAVLVAAICTIGLAAEASARAFKGTVVHRNARAHSFVVALPSGQLRAIHARRSPRGGKVVLVSGRRLRNGTWSSSSIRAVGARHRVRIRGTVTYVNRRRGLFTLSARGTSVLVHRRTRRGQVRAAVTSGLPPVGRVVVADVTTDGPGTLQADNVNEVGPDTGTIDLEGVILAVDANASTITLSADDQEESGASVVIHAGPTFDLSKYAVGQTEQFAVTQNPDGTFELVGSSGDDNGQVADDQSGEQGDNSDDGAVDNTDDGTIDDSGDGSPADPVADAGSPQG
jgi:hypothetical protein